MAIIEAFAVMFTLWAITAGALYVLGFTLASIVDETKLFGYSPTLDRLTKRK